MTFTFNFTQSQLDQLIHTTNNAAWYTSLCNSLPNANITTIPRVAAFLSQTIVESVVYTTLVENLNYSQAALLAIFPTHFSGAADAANYARQPMKIANRIYSNRMGNGNEASGDGWLFRGRGLIQITGRANYTAFSQATGVDSVNNPDLLSEFDGAVSSACWYWTTNNLNSYADANEITLLSQKINGGNNGLQQRIATFNQAWTVLSS